MNSLLCLEKVSKKLKKNDLKRMMMNGRLAVMMEKEMMLTRIGAWLIS